MGVCNEGILSKLNTKNKGSARENYNPAGRTHETYGVDCQKGLRRWEFLTTILKLLEPVQSQIEKISPHLILQKEV